MFNAAKSCYHSFCNQNCWESWFLEWFFIPYCKVSKHIKYAGIFNLTRFFGSVLTLTRFFFSNISCKLNWNKLYLVSSKFKSRFDRHSKTTYRKFWWILCHLRVIYKRKSNLSLYFICTIIWCVAFYCESRISHRLSKITQNHHREISNELRPMQQ